jgi:Flagellar hook-length control protein FliK
MTAIAPAPASTHAPLEVHSAHSVHGALSQSHDPLTFAAVLDSTPGGEAKAKPSSGERAQTLTDSPPRDRPQTQIPNPSFFNAALAASLPLAPTTTIANGEPAGDTNPPALAPNATAQGSAPDAASAPRVASAVEVADTLEARLISERSFHASAAASIPAPDAEAGDALGARLIAERSFHANVSASNPATAQPTGGSSSVVDPPSLAIAALDAPEVAVRSPRAAMPRPSPATAPSPPASPSTPPETNASRADRTPAAGYGPVPISAGRARGERQLDPAATVAHVAAPAADKLASAPEARPPNGSGSDGSAGLPANGGSNALQSAPSQTIAAVTPQLTAAFADPQSRLGGAPPAAQAPRASPAPSAAPVREIDVDLSPGGLEDVSMTMRLASDKLSLVIRAGSSQTTGAIEGARDAIAERLAAIGQPLGSLIIQQTGSTNDATNARDSGDGRGEDRPQGRGGDANDPRGARRGSSGF